MPIGLESEACAVRNARDRGGRPEVRFTSGNSFTNRTNAMLLSLKQLYGRKLAALDGEIGQVKDIYFEDQKQWAIRYLVVDTGNWLVPRAVLIAPHAFGALEFSEKLPVVNLTCQQIERCPSIDLHKPVSRQYEDDYHRHYGWPGYWQGDGLCGLSDVPLLGVLDEPLPGKSGEPERPEGARKDAHLRSAQAVSGYHVQADDQMSGYVCDFLMDGRSWVIAQLVVKIGHRFSGKEVLIPTGSVSRFSYEESTVFVSLSEDSVEHSPEYVLTPVALDE